MRLTFHENTRGRRTELVALDGGTPVARIAWRERNGQQWVSDWRVSARVRRKGVGRALIVEFLERHGDDFGATGQRFVMATVPAKKTGTKVQFELGDIRANQLPRDVIVALRMILDELGY